MIDTRFIVWDNQYLEETIQLYIDVFSAEPWNDVLTYEEIKLYLDRILAMNTFEGYLALDDTDAVIAASLGFIRPWFRGIQYHLDSFYIARTHQSKGLGGAFLDFVKNDLAQKNIPSIALDTEIGYPSDQFYRKHGFSNNPDSVTMYGSTQLKK
ncbi:GNAT family N-acetyltransferase [Listeria newyorkensis]|uniref:GNAT family N-acetyltransferase n=1 Tax=Listeria newyorkensis TaxID=1497681 RepID=A0A841YZP5_9LIST|nr:GNAT family N-acetyltransferase [Listeria newyorkensis]MBC1458392.1 GNAT family N-acetyltransferase [Listeria newyorkensis]